MAERPAILTAEQVRDALAGRDVVTVKDVKPQPACDVPGLYADRYNKGERWAYWLPDGRMDAPRTFACPLGAPGERLWVREVWAFEHIGGRRVRPWYRADQLLGDPPGIVWRRPDAMPRSASRLTLEVVSVDVRRNEAGVWQWVRTARPVGVGK